jgi:hypothetical protein
LHSHVTAVFIHLDKYKIRSPSESTQIVISSLFRPGWSSVSFNMSSSRGGIDRESDSKMSFDTSESIKVMPTFDSLNLKEDLLRGIYAYSKTRARSFHLLILG